ncbi:hypothetical protein ACIOEX_25325 [Streptomyces sp. NPDC087850]|uniref:hypothetical protein n=1 Tax=unclassified Streptomyces TaxID=2593676 RepID=UPI0038021011
MFGWPHATVGGQREARPRGAGAPLPPLVLGVIAGLPAMHGMARTERAEGSHRGAKEMADAIITSRTDEIARMRALLGS